MPEFFRCRQIIANPFAIRSFQLRPKATAIRKCNLVSLTRPNREKLSTQESKCRTLCSSYAEELAHHTQGQRSRSCSIQPSPTITPPVEAPTNQSPTSPISPDTKYCAICISLGKVCPYEYHMSSDWDEDLKDQERKIQEIEDQKDIDRKTP